jgi:hypothetical protein
MNTNEWVSEGIKMDQLMDKPSRSHATIETPDAFNRASFTISDLSSEFDVTARACENLFAARQGAAGVDIAGEARGL